MKYGFGVDLGGTTVKIAYFDENGTMLDKWEIPTDLAEQGKNILPDIAAALQNFLTEKGVDRSDVIGIGDNEFSYDEFVNSHSDFGVFVDYLETLR